MSVDPKYFYFALFVVCVCMSVVVSARVRVLHMAPQIFSCHLFAVWVDQLNGVKNADVM